MSLVNISGVGYGGSGIPDRVPKALAELQGLTISGPLTGDTAETDIEVAAIESEDTVLKALLLDGANPVVDLTDDISIVDRRASGTLTIDPAIADADEVEVNGKTYVFTDVTVTPCVNLAPGVVPITVNPSGVADEEEAADNLAAAIMSNDSTLTCSVVGAVVTIKNRVAGVVGNSKTLDVTGSNAHVARSGATLAGGTASHSIQTLSTNTTGKQIILFWYNKQ